MEGLAVERLAKRRAQRTLWSGLSFAAPRGRVTAVGGRSGTGKTTLLRCLTRLEPVDAGRVLLDGIDCATLPAPALRRRVGLVAQRPAMLPGSVRANLEHGVGTLSADALDAAMTAAALPAALLERDAGALSGGETARVAVARALTRAPDVLVLDEPTAALDDDAAGVIATTLRGLAEQGMAVLVATHDAQLIARCVDAVVELAPPLSGTGATPDGAPAR